MRGKVFAALTAVLLFFMAAGPVQGGAAEKSREIGKTGEWRGTIRKLQTVRCSADPGDKRYCKRVYLDTGPGGPVTSRLHLYTEITRNRKVIYPGPDEDKSMADQANFMDRLVKKVLKPGAAATVSVSCSGDDLGCAIDRIDLH